MNLIGIHKVTMEFLAKIIPGLEEIEPSILQRLYVEGTQRQSNLFCLIYVANYYTVHFAAIYKSYLERQKAEVQAFRKDEEMLLPEDLDYDL